MIELNIDEDSKINPNDLDLEWREQPHLFGLYVKVHVNAIQELSRIKSKLDSEYRENWNPDWGKFSESACKVKIDTSIEIIEMEYKVNLAAGYIKTMEQKKQALENLVKLAGMNWFSTPKEPKNLNRNSRFDERAITEEVKGRVHENLNRGKKRRTD